MVQHGFPLPVDFLMVLGEAVVGVYRPPHKILLPQRRHPQTLRGNLLQREESLKMGTLRNLLSASAYSECAL